MVALRSFIDAFDAEGLQQVKPLIPQLLDVFFQLMQEVGSSTSLCFPLLQQLAAPLAGSVCVHFGRCIGQTAFSGFVARKLLLN